MSRDTLVWIAILATAAGCYGWKVLGLSIPHGILDRPLVRRFAALVPVALLAALTAVQTLSAGGRLVVDARLAGVAVAAVAVLLRAPFLVAVGAAVAVTAGLRLTGLG